jgi:hypothetical protein
MQLFSRHHVFLRCVSIFTALTFLPGSVQAWHFLPAVYGEGAATDSIDLEALLDMEASLRTASQPVIPNSPLRLVGDAPGRADASPAPQTVEGGLSSPPLPNAEGKPFNPPLPHMEGELSSSPFEPNQLPGSPLPEFPATPEGLASKLAQAEGAAANLNLAITPTPLKEKLNHPAPTSTVPRPKTELSYVPVPR